MSTDNIETQAAVEGDLLPQDSSGKLAEDGVLMAMRMMNTEEKFELMKQATKILNGRNRRMNKALRVARARAPSISIEPPRVRIRFR